MTIIGGIGEGVGYGTLIGIETAVVVVGMEVFAAGIYRPLIIGITDILCDHIAI